MIRTLTDAPAQTATRRCLAVLCLLLGASPAVHAQPGAAAGDGAPSEAARRAAMSPYRFILAAPARKPPGVEKEKDKDAEARKARPAAPVEAPVQAAARAPAPAPVAAPVEVAPAPVAAPAPEPVQTAAHTRPAEPVPAPRHEVIAVRTDEPRLSAALIRERPNGVVRVRFEIHPDGSAKEATVVSSTNHALNRATLEAVSGWKFRPVDSILTVETEVAYKF